MRRIYHNQEIAFALSEPRFTVRYERLLLKDIYQGQWNLLISEKSWPAAKVDKKKRKPF